MPVIVSAVGASLLALLVVVIAEWFARSTAADDPEPAERWLIGALARHPALRRAVTTLDSKVWGGAMVALAFAAVLAAGAFIGWIFTTIDDESGFVRFDSSVAEWGSERATDASTNVLQAITYLGDTMVMLPLALVVGLIAMWRRPGTNWGIIGFLATVVIGVSLINNGLKWLIMRERPEVDHLVGSGGSSFPSGHTAAAAACWAAISLVVASRMKVGTRRWAAAGAVAIAVLVAASRVMLGVHWLTDVMAGLTVGWTWFFLVALLFGGRVTRLGEPAERARSTAEHDAAFTDDEPFTDDEQGAMSDGEPVGGLQPSARPE
jgi:undecaprenyl-diphosphatase